MPITGFKGHVSAGGIGIPEQVGRAQIPKDASEFEIVNLQQGPKEVIYPHLPSTAWILLSGLLPLTVLVFHPASRKNLSAYRDRKDWKGRTGYV